MLRSIRLAGNTVPHRYSRLSGALIGLLALTACGGGGGGGDEPTAGNDLSINPNLVDISGTISAAQGPVDGVGVTSYKLIAPATDDMQADTTTDAEGGFSLSVPKFADTYLQVEKPGYATANTQFSTFGAEKTGVDLPLVSVAEAEQLIDAAFGGFGLGLADRAWLMINVEDVNGNEVNSVPITTTPEVAAGGALDCDGTFTGGNYTTAYTGCVGRGAMYLAFFDEDSEVTIFAGDGASSRVAPVRLGELTAVTIEWQDGNVPSAPLVVHVQEGGTVRTTPEYFTCIGPATCTARVPLETEVFLAATPAPGFQLDDWDGCHSELDTQCSRIIYDHEPNEINAEFDPASGPVRNVKVTVEVGSGGVVTTTPNILQCAGADTCEALVPVGTILTLNAVPLGGYVFDDWDGCDQEPSGQAGTCLKSIAGDEPNLLRAEFDPE